MLSWSAEVVSRLFNVGQQCSHHQANPWRGQPGAGASWLELVYSLLLLCPYYPLGQASSPIPPAGYETNQKEERLNLHVIDINGRPVAYCCCIFRKTNHVFLVNMCTYYNIIRDVLLLFDIGFLKLPSRNVQLQ